ncbi:hypothetical protein [Paenibacillus sp. UNC451MF]|uniref:hypothetical protein n=1 Tax=Paenibacillus sp. UNC451MF TaxID=1449063 RepID=UPI00048F0EBC|nr:hypothetical protein [Paenibacillus sp. UNC451MF]
MREQDGQVYRQYEELHHDVGFMWSLSSVANYKTDGEQGVEAACFEGGGMAGRFNIRSNFIRAWNDTNFKGENVGVV